MRRSCCSGVASLSQAHISNFLNKKRALSLDGLDRVLAAQNLTVDQLIPLDICASDSQPPTTDPIEAIPVVSPTTAMDEPVVRPGSVIETIHVSASRLQDNRSRASAKVAQWQRFVAVRALARWWCWIAITTRWRRTALSKELCMRCAAGPDWCCVSLSSTMDG